MRLVKEDVINIAMIPSDLKMFISKWNMYIKDLDTLIRIADQSHNSSEFLKNIGTSVSKDLLPKEKKSLEWFWDNYIRT